MRVLSLLLLCTLLGSPLAHGTPTPAPDTTNPTGSMGLAYVAVGASMVDLDNLNRILRGLGYPSFSRTAPSVGVGGYRIVGPRLLIGGEAQGNVWGTGTGRGRTITLWGGYGLVNVGYLFQPLSNVRIYPLLGVGGGVFNVDIEGAAPSFEAALRYPTRSVSLQRRSAFVSASVAADYHVWTGTDHYVHVGLQLGYLTAPYSSKWHVEETAVSDGPTAGLQGPFVRLILGR